MKGKNKSLELKLYEFLGVRKIKRLLTNFANNMVLRDARKKGITDEEEIEKLRQNQFGNYFINKDLGYDGLKAFNKQLKFNSEIHGLDLAFSIFGYFFTPFLPAKIFFILWSILNIYLLMIQRYNYIRTNNAFNRRQSINKNRLNEEMKSENLLLEDLTYKVINSRGKAKSISSSELIDLLTYKELKILRKYLEYINHLKEIDKIFLQKDFDTLPLSDDRKLKMTLK